MAEPAVVLERGSAGRCVLGVCGGRNRHARHQDHPEGEHQAALPRDKSSQVFPPCEAIVSETVRDRAELHQPQSAGFVPRGTKCPRTDTAFARVPKRGRYTMAVTKTQTEMQSINPATEEVLGTFPLSSRDEVEKGLEQAANAFRSWRTTAFA